MIERKTATVSMKKLKKRKIKWIQNVGIMSLLSLIIRAATTHVN